MIREAFGRSALTQVVANLKDAMKFLEYTPFDSINYFLSSLNLGECTLKGNLEGFSCKHVTMDKKLSLSLEHEILDYLSKSSESDSSPSDYLSSRSSRKTLIYLVLTLNHMYPDHDFRRRILGNVNVSFLRGGLTSHYTSFLFSAVQAHQHFSDKEWDTFKQMFETYMFEASKEWDLVNADSSLFDSIAKAIDEVVRIPECEIYSFNPDFEVDPFLEKGAIWSFHFFFYHRKLKRVVSFRCSCVSNLVNSEFLEAHNNLLNNADDDHMLDEMEM